MDSKKLAIASLAVLIVHQITNFLIHNVVLSDAYAMTESLWRPMDEMASMMWIMIVVAAVWAVIFVYIFAKMRSGGGIVEGMKFPLPDIVG